MDEMLILLLKYLLYLVMIGATVAIFGEIVPMARGKTARRPPSSNNVEE